MPELTREEKLKLIEKLPERLIDFLYSEDTGAFLLYLGKKYNLPDEKISVLSKMVADIILKITPITSLVQEISNKVVADPQIAMAIAQELNNELLTPVLMPAPAIPVTPTMPPAPVAPARPAPDQYREPMREAPEIIDLRKTPPPPMPMPIAVAPIPPRPLTFTKPIEPIKPQIQTPMPIVPLIEAEPHKVASPALKPQEPITELPRPQYIIRPPGLAPTDLPHDVLDLRKDKGEF